MSKPRDGGAVISAITLAEPPFSLLYFQMNTMIQLYKKIQSLMDAETRTRYSTGTTVPSARDQLKQLTPDDLFNTTITDPNLAKCCLSGLWLLNNFLDDSHTISQSIPTPEGSFWHAIMHRLEGDFSNSKYWYRQVGEHPVLANLSQCTGENFDPFDFVDHCQQESRTGQDSPLVQSLALAEWSALFEYCHQGATS